MRLIDKIKPTIAAFAATTSLDEDVINMGKCDGCLVIIMLTISSGTDTGAVTLLQTTDLAVAGSKAITFTKMWANIVGGDDLTETTVASNTFDIGGVETTPCMWIIDVPSEALDADNAFYGMRCNVADITNGEACVLYIPYNLRFSGVNSAPTLLT